VREELIAEAFPLARALDQTRDVDELDRGGYHDAGPGDPLQLGEARITLQFRAELYNAFNSMQISGVNTSATFDTNGNQTNAAFGQVTSARDSRRIQLAARFTF
jgi:hypothetical protein